MFLYFWVKEVENERLNSLGRSLGTTFTAGEIRSWKASGSGSPEYKDQDKVFLLFKKKQQTRELSGELSDGQVFSPRGTIRTFNIAFDIQEMGDGTAKITLAKIKAQEL